MMDDGDDGYRRVDDLLDAGWIDEDDASELRELIKFIDIPTENSKALAAFTLIDHILNPRQFEVGSAEHTRHHWAKVKLNRHVLI